MSIIDPSTINLLTLPSVSLEQRAALPTNPCVYLAVDREGKVQYIGRSNNPRKRWQAHHRGIELALLGGVRIAYLESNANFLPEIERALITHFRPPLNQPSSNLPSPICEAPPAQGRTQKALLGQTHPRRCKGEGTGRIQWRVFTKKNGNQYQQPWYDWQIHQGEKTISRSTYIPKRLLSRIQELEDMKVPVKEILIELGVIK